MTPSLSPSASGTDSNPSSTAASPPRPSWLRRLPVREGGTLLGLLLIGLIFSVLTSDFLTVPNLINVLQQSSINACVALGMTLVIICGGIDLSVGSTAALSAVLSATMMAAKVPAPVAVAAGLAIGVVCGLINGGLVVWGRLQPFIVTLGTLSVFRAVALIYTNGNPIFSIPKPFRQVVQAKFGILPMPVIIVLFLGLLTWLLLRKTPVGEYLLAVGGNEEASRVSGVPVGTTKITAYVCSGLLASIAALIVVARLGAAEPILGDQWELDAIAAAAIGGASLMGGKGSIFGTLVGALILSTMRDGLTLLHVQAFYQKLATGLIILAAMFVDRFTRGKE